jgi:hypothetical protein
MRERPILFNGAIGRAISVDQKTSSLPTIKAMQARKACLRDRLDAVDARAAESGGMKASVNVASIARIQPHPACDSSCFLERARLRLRFRRAFGFHRLQWLRRALRLHDSYCCKGAGSGSSNYHVEVPCWVFLHHNVSSVVWTNTVYRRPFPLFKLEEQVA